MLGYDICLHVGISSEHFVQNCSVDYFFNDFLFCDLLDPMSRLLTSSDCLSQIGVNSLETLSASLYWKC